LGIGRLVSEPKDLAGKRVSVKSWTHSASVWQRGLLVQHYGVELSSIEWVAEMAAHGEGKGGPEWARITPKPRERSLDQMLASGATSPS
jgi:4,5-dihydroxyphthalate decarboxylase